jgi:soluble lytic murein transglycosylase-like protein
MPPTPDPVMSRQILVRGLAPLAALLGAGCAHAQVFELGADGAFTEISKPAWEAPATPQLVGLTQPNLAVSPAKAVVRQHIEVAAHRYGISSDLLDAVAWQESRYNPRARSPVGAMGVMQLMPGTARDLGVRNPHDVEQNVSGGAAYLRAQLLRFGNNVPLALAAYNAGPGAVQRYRGIPPYRETRNYVRQILHRISAMTGFRTQF